MNWKKIAVVALVSGLASSALASVTDDLMAIRAGRGAAVTPGVWHSDLNKARAYAEANGLPLVAVWSNGDECAHCVAFENCVMSAAFRNWIKDSGIVFYFGVRNDAYDGQEGYHGSSFYWCCRNQNASMSWPYVRVWWPKRGLDEVHSGSWYDGEDQGKPMRCSYKDGRTDLANFIYPGDYGTYNPGGRRIISVLVGTATATAVMPVGGGAADGGLLAGFNPVTYAGGEFGFTYHPSYPDAGIQVEYDTDRNTWAVPLTRNNASARTKAARNGLLVTYPSGHQEIVWVDWAANQAQATAIVNIDKSWLVGTSKLVTLQLYSDKIELKQTSYAFCVDKVPNSPSNPFFDKERTKDTLNWGEWTMDVGAAIQKVSEAGGSANNAYVLVLCGGELWCPDCANTDKNLFDRPEFKTWATSTHKVALVVIDIPNSSAGNGPDGTSACLLTSVIGTTSAGYRTAKGMDASGTYQCGVNYQSRHGVTWQEAAQIYARNKTYAAGILNKLIPSNPYRPGVPTIYALRPDGTIAGRIAEFASTSPTAWTTNYLTRLDELLTLVDEEREERDNGLCGDKNIVISGNSKRGVEGTLSLADDRDVYRLNAQKDSDLMLTVSGPDSAKVEISVLDGRDDAVVTNTTGVLATGVALSCTLPSSNCYVRVATADWNYFKAAKDGSTVAHYTVKTDSVIAPGETFETTEPIDCSGGCADLGDGATNIWIKLEKDAKYKFSGLAPAHPVNDAALSYDGETRLYTAKTSGRTQLVLIPDAGGMIVFGYQLWVPGMIEFYPAVQTVKERGDTEEYDYIHTINVRRTGGLSGWAGATISLDTAKSTRLPGSYAWNNEGKPLVWGEGDNGVLTATVTIKADSHADGKTKLVFKLTPLANDGEGHDCTSAVSEEELVLTIVDDDEAQPGRAALVQAGGLDIPASRSVVVKGGANYVLALQRLDGSDGPLEVKVMADVTNELGSAVWAPREGTEAIKEVTFPLPNYADGAANKMSIAIVGQDGAKVVAAQKYLSIAIIPDDAVMFENQSKVVSGLTRNVKHAVEETVALDGVTGADVKIVKLSGTVAPGTSWTGTLSGGSTPGLSITGTPTAAGTYTAVFQVVNDVVAGGTVQVTMKVADPVEATDEFSEPLNPYLATTRTFSDMMVVDVDKERLIGLLTVTVPRSGRLSGKYRSIDGTTVSLLSEEWDSCEDGNYTATLKGVLYSTYTAVVRVDTNGTIGVTFTEPNETYAGDKQVCIPRTSMWEDGDGAVAWQGYYTVSLPFKKPIEAEKAFANGDGFVTLKMNDAAAVKSGRVLYSGVLANGKAFSGTAVLEAQNATAALLPVFTVGESDTVTGVFKLDKSEKEKYREVTAYENAYPYWSHMEKVAAASYSGKLEVHGCLYNKSEILNCCVNTFATQYLYFFALPETLVDSDKFGIRASYLPYCPDGRPVWSTNDIYAVAVMVTNVGGDNILLYSPDRAKSVHGLTMNFNPDTGLLSGQLWLDFYETASTGTRVPATYRGIVKPGWGKIPAGCGSCSDVPTPQEAPFISGACFFPDTFEYELGTQTRHLQIKRGCPFSIGLEKGE